LDFVQTIECTLTYQNFDEQKHFVLRELTKMAPEANDKVVEAFKVACALQQRVRIKIFAPLPVSTD